MGRFPISQYFPKSSSRGLPLPTLTFNIFSRTFLAPRGGTRSVRSVYDSAFTQKITVNNGGERRVTEKIRSRRGRKKREDLIIFYFPARLKFLSQTQTHSSFRAVSPSHSSFRAVSRMYGGSSSSGSRTPTRPTPGERAAPGARRRSARRRTMRTYHASPRRGSRRRSRMPRRRSRS